MTDIMKSDERIQFNEVYQTVFGAIRSGKGKKALAKLDRCFMQALNEIESLNGSLANKREVVDEERRKVGALTHQIASDRDLLKQKDDQLRSSYIQVARITAERDAIQNLHIGTIVRIIKD